MMNNTTTATEKQISFLTTLVRDRDASVEFLEKVQARLEAGITKADASAAIDYLTRRPRKQLAEQPSQPEVGVYVFPNGQIVKTQPNKAGTNVYTKCWVEINGERLVDATEERVHGEWEYAPELKSQLGTARKMTLDEAKAFILRYGQCCRCSRKLKAADSVERGIGPVCVKYFGGFA